MRFNDTSKLLEIDTDGDGTKNMEMTLTGVSLSDLDANDFTVTAPLFIEAEAILALTNVIAGGLGLTVVPNSTTFTANIKGDEASAVTFDSVNFGTVGSTVFDLGEGLVLSSGDATPSNSNTSNGFGKDAGGAAGVILGENATDASLLTFNFTAPAGTEALVFEWMYGTEEFPEFGNNFTDIAAVFVDGINYLSFANGQKVEYIKTQGGDPGTTGFFNNNTSSSVANAGSAGALNIEYDGVTPPDLVVGLLNTNLSIHTLQIVVSDTSDKVYDTALYLDPIALGVAGFTATSDTSDVAFGTNGINTLTGDSGNNQLYGLKGDDVLSGAAGSDKLYGGQGSDTLDGGSGSDLLHGGSGADIFKYTAASNSGSTTVSADLIGDFRPPEGDKIQLTSDGFGDLSSLTQGTNYVEIAFSGGNLGVLKTALDDGTIETLVRAAGVADDTDYLAFLTFTDNATSSGGIGANNSGNFLLYDDDDNGSNGVTVLADMGLTTADLIAPTDFTFV